MAIRTNIKRTLGANYPAGASQVVLFIPDHSRDGDSIDQQYWVDEALNVMGQVQGRPLQPSASTSITVTW